MTVKSQLLPMGLDLSSALGEVLEGGVRAVNVSAVADARPDLARP